MQPCMSNCDNFQHVLYNQADIKEVVIGIDFFAFNKFIPSRPDFDETRLERSLLTENDIISTLLSKDAISLNLATLSSNRREPDYQSFQKNGMISDQQIIHELRDRNRRDVFSNNLSNFINNPELYAHYELSTEKLNYLKMMVDICHNRNISLKVFISPSHATQMEAIRVAGLWPVFEKWKREETQIIPTWDFTGYNGITVEPISNSMVYYSDNSHYRKVVGNLILNRLLNNISMDAGIRFGVLLTPDNIEENLDRIRQEREAWAQINSDVVSFVQQLRH